jgi:GlcNAc-P-P-Und epimerase
MLCMLLHMFVLLTGSTGFLGQLIDHAFRKKQISLLTLNRSQGSDYVCDLSLSQPLLKDNIEAVIHSAGLAHVLRTGPDDDQIFYRSHVVGMQNLLNSLDPKVCRKFIFISSVSVYGKDSGELISESLIPTPTTPYAKYKYQAEQILIEWARKNNVAYWILRPPLIVGKNPPGNLQQLIRYLKKNMYVHINSVNPPKCMVLATDIADFLSDQYHNLNLENSGVYNLTDGANPKLQIFIKYLVKQYNPNFIHIYLPQFLIQILAKTGDRFRFLPLDSVRLNNLSRVLTFDDSKARSKIKWNGRSVVSG